MSAEEILARIVSTFPEALAAWISVGLLLTLLRVRDPRVRSAAWTLALVDALLPLAGAGSAVLVTARLALAPGTNWDTAGVPALPVLCGILMVSAALIVRRVLVALRVERFAASLATTCPAADGTSVPGVRTALPPGDGTPFVAGLLRPVVVLPASFWARLGAGERRAVLGHEAAHLRRGDRWISFAEGLAADLLWFNPLVRMLAVRAADERESLADRRAMRDGADVADLARAIVAAAAVEGSVPAGATTFCGRRGGPLERRLRLLAAPRRAVVAALQCAALLLFLPWSPGAAQNGVHTAAAEEMNPDEGGGRILVGLAWRANPIQAAVCSWAFAQ